MVILAHENKFEIQQHVERKIPKTNVIKSSLNWAISLWHLHTRKLQAPVSPAEDSKYVEFWLTVSPHDCVTAKGHQFSQLANVIQHVLTNTAHSVSFGAATRGFPSLRKIDRLFYISIPKQIPCFRIQPRCNRFHSARKMFFRQLHIGSYISFMII